MNHLQRLRTHVEALQTAVQHDEEFFAPIIHYVHRLRTILVDSPTEITCDELVLLSQHIEDFFRRWRPSPNPPSSRVVVLYVPPRQTSGADPIVLEIQRLIAQIAALSKDEFQDQLKELLPARPKNAVRWVTTAAGDLGFDIAQACRNGLLLVG